MKNITKDIRISIVALCILLAFGAFFTIHAKNYDNHPIDNDTPTVNNQINLEHNDNIAPPVIDNSVEDVDTPSIEEVVDTENEITDSEKDEVLGDIITETEQPTDDNTSMPEDSNVNDDESDANTGDAIDSSDDEVVETPDNNETAAPETESDIKEDVAEPPVEDNVDNNEETNNSESETENEIPPVNEEIPPVKEEFPTINEGIPPVKEEVPPVEEIEPVVEYLNPTGSFANIDYSIYSPEQKEIIDMILEKINANIDNVDIKEETFSIEHYLSLEDYYAIASFFYVYYGQKEATDYTFDYIKSGSSNGMTYQICIHYDNVRRFDAELQKVHDKIDSVLSTFTVGSEKHILNQIAEYLGKTIVYTNGHYDVRSAILEGKAVCNGYALAFNMMANRAGITTDMCIGKTTKGEYHAWNRVTLSNGEYRYYDVTWYDGKTVNTKYLYSKTSFHGEFLINNYVGCWFRK